MAGDALRRFGVQRGAAMVAAASMLVAVSCSSNNSSTNSGSGTPAQNVFVQKFRYHGMPTTLSSGNTIINFSNRENLPITHEMVVIAIPQGKTKQDVIDDAKAKGAKSEDDWLHFGEIGEVNTGATISGVFDLPAGTYALACWQDGNLGGGKGKVHAARGMVFQFTVS